MMRKPYSVTNHVVAENASGAQATVNTFIHLNLFPALPGPGFIKRQPSSRVIRAAAHVFIPGF
jgi:hypothetical protein